MEFGISFFGILISAALVLCNYLGLRYRADKFALHSEKSSLKLKCWEVYVNIWRRTAGRSLQHENVEN